MRPGHGGAESRQPVPLGRTGRRRPGRYPRKLAAAAGPARDEIETLHFCPRAHAYLIYVYRPARLQAILGRDAPRALLRAAGYPAAGGCRRCLDCLCARLRQGGEFPHEIGVFLDYPLADVVGFIQNRGKNSTFTGYWKSYQDPEQARAQYARLRKCTEVYLRCYRSGTPVAQLTVAA